MADIKACRICLVVDVPLIYLHKNLLEMNFHLLMSEDLLTVDLPPYVCRICCSLITKFCSFRDRCCQGQNILYDILNTEGSISTNSIRKVYQGSLKSNLSIRSPSEETIIYVLHQDEVEIKPEPLSERCKKVKGKNLEKVGAVKHEEISTNSHKGNRESVESKLLLRSPFEETITYVLHQEEVGVKPEPGNDVEDKHSADDIKMESNLPKSVSQVSSDDEPLSESCNKVKKKKNKQKSIEKVRAVNHEETRESKLKPDITPVASRKRRGKSIKVTSKVPRPRKTRNTGGVDLDDDDNIEEYATVIPLTLEEQLEEMEKRKTSKNYTNSLFKCDLCYRGHIDSAAWKHHVLKHDPSSGDFVCGVCKFRFKTKRCLDKHLTLHDNKYQCKLCPFVSKTKTQAKQHHRWHKGITYKCEQCGEVFTKSTSYLSHVRKKHPSEHICGICGYSYISQFGLAQHKSMMHSQVTSPEQEQETDSDLYCSLCDVKFDNHEALKRHVAKSNKHIDEGCRECGAWFRSALELQAHTRAEHSAERPRPQNGKNNSTEWPKTCEYCSEVISSAGDYWTHFRRSHPDLQYPIKKDHVCDVCGKSFQYNAFLVYHKRTHTEVRSYVCTQCPKRFHNQTNLHNHEKSHSDARPYPCSVCMKGFKSKGALDRHLRCHTGVKPFVCEVCGKEFSQSNSHKLHVRTVHLKQPAPYVSKARQRPKKETAVVMPSNFEYH